MARPRRTTRLPDPQKIFTNIDQRRVPQIEFGARLPIFRARQDFDFQTLAAGAGETDLTFDSWQNCDERYFSETLTGSPAVLRSVSLLQPGVYSINFELNIQALAAGSFVAMILNDGWDSPNVMSYGAFVGAGGDYVYHQVKHYSTIPVLGNDPAVTYPPWAIISFDAAQNSGVDRDTQYATGFEIIYLGLYSCEEVTN